MGSCSSVGRNKWPIFLLGLRNSGPNFFFPLACGKWRSFESNWAWRKTIGGRDNAAYYVRRKWVGRSVDGTGEIGQKMGSFERDTSIFDSPPKICRAQNFYIDVRFFSQKKIKLAGRLFRMWQIDERRVYVYVCV